MARKVSDKYPPSKYLKVDDLNGRPFDITVTRVTEEEIGQDKRDVFVLYSRETPKGFVLGNRINGDTIGEFLGTDDVDAWIGAVITLIPAKTSFGGQRVPCIRVKAARYSKGQPAPADDDTLPYLRGPGDLAHELEDADDDADLVQ